MYNRCTDAREYMSKIADQMVGIDTKGLVDKRLIVDRIKNVLINNGYNLIELNDKKPWGAYFRLDNSDANRFIKDFFPNLSLADARLGNGNLEISPKILLVSPRQRLSWQYHNRRSESWSFLSKGFYIKSSNDEEGDVETLGVGDVVRFSAKERHRLVGFDDSYTLVAEIWQHINPNQPSDEDDIVRLRDDYGRL